MGLKRRKSLVHILILIIASPIILSLIPTVQAQWYSMDSVTYPSGPEEFVFVYDTEDIISADDEIEIQGISEKLHNETGIPIVVVVINRMIDYKWSGSIEGYALRLFDEWGIGYAEHNYGMLLLISVQDREARIELGHSWSGTINDECDSIMQDLLVPKFKDGKFSEGILGGVEALSDVAKGGEVSGLALKLFGTTTFPVIFWIFVAIVAQVGIMSFRDVIQNGKEGWGKYGLIAIGSFLLLALIYIEFTEVFVILLLVIFASILPAAGLVLSPGSGSSSGSRGSWSSGGGFGGSSGFRGGGGFGGGGGSTGRW